MASLIAMQATVLVLLLLQDTVPALPRQMFKFTLMRLELLSICWLCCACCCMFDSPHLSWTLLCIPQSPSFLCTSVVCLLQSTIIEKKHGESFVWSVVANNFFLLDSLTLVNCRIELRLTTWAWQVTVWPSTKSSMISFWSYKLNIL